MSTDTRNVTAAWTALTRGDLNQAERLASQQISFAPNDPTVNLILGIVCTRTGRLDAAIGYLSKAAVADPNLFEAANWSAFALFRAGRFEEAEAFARKAVRIQSMNGDAWNNLGLSLFGQGKVDEAIEAYKTSIRFAPMGPTYFNLGDLYYKVQRFPEADSAFRSAYKKGVVSLNLYLRLTELAHMNRQTLDAVRFGNLAVQTAPNNPEALRLLASALRKSGDAAGAESLLRKAMEIDPNDIQTLNTYAYVLVTAGRFQESREVFLRSLEIEPNQSIALPGILNNGKVTEKDLPLIEQAKELAQREELSAIDRVTLTFSVGKSLNDLKRFDEAMSAFDEAHRLRKSLHGPFDPGAYLAIVDRMIELYTKEAIDSSRFGRPTDQPIFILGMIRSGTTLAEQIVSSHRQIRSAGEFGAFMTPGGISMVDVAIDRERFPGQIDTYLAGLNTLGNNSPRITDKMPMNYLSLGKIRSAFPNAKIIHMRRNPIDTCLSIWTTSNVTSALWADEKEDIVAAYRNYQKLMAHWRTVIPSDRLLEVDYEQLVLEKEPTVRKMIQFLDLEWDEACLSHQDNDRVIDTPSTWQARQPVYHSSLRRRDDYASSLGAFTQLE